MGNVWDGVKNTNLQDEFKCCNVYAKEKCRKCFARFYHDCAFNTFLLEFTSQIIGICDGSVEIVRICCAIMIKAAEAEN